MNPTTPTPRTDAKNVELARAILPDGGTPEDGYFGMLNFARTLEREISTLKEQLSAAGVLVKLAEDQINHLDRENAELKSSIFTTDQLTHAVNANCTCGGGGPSDQHTCPACQVYHALTRQSLDEKK